MVDGGEDFGEDGSYGAGMGYFVKGGGSDVAALWE